MKFPLFDRTGLIVAITTLIGSYFYFSWHSGNFQMSAMGAFLSAALVWVCYAILRWLVIASRT